MKRKVIRLTESQLHNLVKKNVKEWWDGSVGGIPVSNSPEHQYNLEDFSDWEFDDTGGETIFRLYYGDDDKFENYEIEWDVYQRGSYSPATLESPEEYPEMEIEIESIKQVHPIEKEINEKEFFELLNKLGILGKFWNRMDDLGADRLNNRDDYYEPDYDDRD